MTIKKLICFILSLQMTATTVLAADMTGSFTKAEDITGNAGNIFISGQSPGAVLMKVNLWGAVVKSGIHYIPPRTDFVTLLSYAGGPFANADLENAYIKRQAKENEEIIPVNIKDLVGKISSHNPQIEPNDIVIIPEVEATVSDNTFKTLTLVSTILSIVLAGVVLENQFSND